MTTLPDSQPVEPTKKPDSEIHHVTIALVGLILFIVVLIIFYAGLSGQGGLNSGNAPGIGPAGSTNAMTPAAMEMPIAEIATKSVICQVTGMLSISGTVKNNANHPLSVEMVGAGYDSNDVETGTGYDTVTINLHGTSPSMINVLDGCQLDETGTYEVRIVDISWRHTT